jgi:hypothetical protein
VLNASVAPPPPTADVTLDRVTVTHAGLVTMSATLTCAAGGFAFVRASLVQRHGNRFAEGAAGEVSVVCGSSWSVDVESVTGVAFKPGPADATANVFMCDPFECVSLEVTRSVHVRRG